jgi:metal-dependent HD superfamily phosphatase/phosphodiesterase
MLEYLHDIDNNLKIYLEKCHIFLGEMGALEHSKRHANIVSERTVYILRELGYDKKTCELGAIAGYLHDLGNLVNRYEHGRTGAFIVHPFLEKMGLSIEEIATVLGAIGNHEENSGGFIVSPVSAAVLIADKSDVARERVRKKDITTFKPRDRVNYAVEKTWLEVSSKNRSIKLNIKIDKEISSVMAYFEIFITKMVLCRRAADFLCCTFELIINDSQLL